MPTGTEIGRRLDLGAANLLFVLIQQMRVGLLPPHRFPGNPLEYFCTRPSLLLSLCVSIDIEIV